MRNIFPAIISVVCHPMLMPAYGLLILFNSGTFISFIPYQAKKYIFLIVLICTVLLPLSFIPFYLFRKIIDDIHMRSNRERIVPLLVNSLFFYLGYLFLSKLQLPPLIKSYMLACAATVFLGLLVSIWWKISLHMLGIGGLIGAVILFSYRLDVDLRTIWMVLILFAGLTGYARLRLDAHDALQVYSGFLLGFGTVSAILLFT